ncbi:MAG: hypothetical protein LBF89_02745 [Bacteroidales bacterium]|nr:hypothetical protein [Bacteroidales bacterium]
MQVLDIIHIWADSRRLFVTVHPDRMEMVSVKDVSKEAAAVCNFVSMVVLRKWKFTAGLRNGNYCYTFFPEPAAPAPPSLESLFDPPKDK